MEKQSDYLEITLIEANDYLIERFSARTQELSEKLKFYFAKDPGLEPYPKNLLYTHTYRRLDRGLRPKQAHLHTQTPPITLIAGRDFNTEQDQFRLIRFLSEDLSQHYSKLIKSLPIYFIAGLRPVGSDGFYMVIEQTDMADQPISVPGFYFMLYVDLPTLEQNAQNAHHLFHEKIEYLFKKLEGYYIDELSEQ